MYLIKMTGDGLSPVERGRLTFDPYALHKAVYAELCAGTDAGRDFLYRSVKGASVPTVYAVSPRVPTSSKWTIGDRPLRTDYTIGDRLMFQLRANAVVERGGQRHGVVLDAIKGGMDPVEAEQTAPAEWLNKRSDNLGFDVESCMALYAGSDEFTRKGRTVRRAVVELSGVVTVSDPTAFAQTLRQGVGRSRAFGYGMMMVKPA